MRTCTVDPPMPSGCASSSLGGTYGKYRSQASDRKSRMSAVSESPHSTRSYACDKRMFSAA